MTPSPQWQSVQAPGHDQEPACRAHRYIEDGLGQRRSKSNSPTGTKSADEFSSCILAAYKVAVTALPCRLPMQPELGERR
jgi:hypothetical protein